MQNFDIDEELLNIEPVFNSVSCVHSNVGMIGNRKIFYISDIHCDAKPKKGYNDISDEEYINHVVTKMNGDGPFGDNPLIILGDIDNKISNVDYFFSQLRMRREGIIIFVLGNHEVWAKDEPTRDLDIIIERYRDVCRKHQVILLHNELAFFYDERTGNGEILQYFKRRVLSEKELLESSTDMIKSYAEKAKMIIFGGLGFSGKCKTLTRETKKRFNAEVGIYRDVVPNLTEDITQTEKCEKAYLKVEESLPHHAVVIATHCPVDNWSERKLNPNYIYLNGHTHHNAFYMTPEKTVFADNQVGYSKDDYELKCFMVSGTYDCFEKYPDGVHEISYEQYIDFNIGMNVTLKKKNDGKRILLLKKGFARMFVYYNANKKLMLLNGGRPKQLLRDIDYYYENLDRYVCTIKTIMNAYTEELLSVSKIIQSFGGDGNIHGCIVDIDYYNHVYVNPIDGKVTPYYAYNVDEKYAYDNLRELLVNHKPALLLQYDEWRSNNTDSNELSVQRQEITNAATLVPDKSIYKASLVIKTIQYLVFQNIVRDWNDRILYTDTRADVVSEIGKINMDDEICKLMNSDITKS